LNALGLLRSPFPGFEMLMLSAIPSIFSGDPLAASILLGLLLSSGVPWLLTAMFLKPGKTRDHQLGPEVAA
jgi:hypothetical protein